jgi:hypothetical protein
MWRGGAGGFREHALDGPAWPAGRQRLGDRVELLLGSLVVDHQLGYGVAAGEH